MSETEIRRVQMASDRAVVRGARSPRVRGCLFLDRLAGLPDGQTPQATAKLSSIGHRVGRAGLESGGGAVE